MYGRPDAIPDTGSVINPRRGAVIAAVVLVMLGSIVAAMVFLLPTASAPELEMTLVSEGVQEITYGESAVYRISIKNTGDKNSNLFPLEITGIPDYWDAELSDPNGKTVTVVSIEANSRKIVTLNVRSPTINAAAEAGEGGYLKRAAYIGVRGGNETVGTVTVLRGTLSLERDGEVTTLYPADGPYDVMSGDLLESTGYAMVELGLSELFSNIGDYNGTIYIGLNDATVGFWRTGDTAFMWVISGSVVVISSGGGGGGGAVRADGSEWELNIGRDPFLDGLLAGLDYNAVLSFGPDMGNGWFYMEVYENGTTNITVIEGSLGVTNQDGSSANLTGLATLTGTPEGEFPPPGPARATIVEIWDENFTESTVMVGGQSVYDYPGVHVVNGPDGRVIYIVPGGADISTQHQGTSGTGSYTARYTTVDDYSVRAFDLSTTSMVNMQDVITMSRDVITIESEEVGKTYDLSMAYRGREGGEKKFSLKDIEVTGEKQTIEVEDWEGLEDDDSPVTFTEGDVTVTVENGDTGEDIKGKLADAGADDDDDTGGVGTMVMIGTGLAIILILLVLFFSRARDMEEEEYEEPDDDWGAGGEDKWEGKEGEQMAAEMDPAGKEQADVKPFSPELPEETPAKPPAPLIPGFPLATECHNCTRRYRVDEPWYYNCRICMSAFRIDDEGDYHRLYRKRESLQDGNDENT